MNQSQMQTNDQCKQTLDSNQPPMQTNHNREPTISTNHPSMQTNHFTPMVVLVLLPGTMAMSSPSLQPT